MSGGDARLAGRRWLGGSGLEFGFAEATAFVFKSAAAGAESVAPGFGRGVVQFCAVWAGLRGCDWTTVAFARVRSWILFVYRGRLAFDWRLLMLTAAVAELHPGGLVFVAEDPVEGLDGAIAERE